MVTAQFFSMSFVKFPMNRLQKEYKIITFETKVDLKFVEVEKTFSPPVHIRVLMLHMQATWSVYS